MFAASPLVMMLRQEADVPRVMSWAKFVCTHNVEELFPLACLPRYADIDCNPKSIGNALVLLESPSSMSAPRFFLLCSLKAVAMQGCGRSSFASSGVGHICRTW